MTGAHLATKCLIPSSTTPPRSEPENSTSPYCLRSRYV